jgi:hypothetical protein
MPSACRWADLTPYGLNTVPYIWLPHFFRTSVAAFTSSAGTAQVFSTIIKARPRYLRLTCSKVPKLYIVSVDGKPEYVGRRRMRANDYGN